MSLAESKKITEEEYQKVFSKLKELKARGSCTLERMPSTDDIIVHHADNKRYRVILMNALEVEGSSCYWITRIPIENTR
jgi:hypothetical protein